MTAVTDSPTMIVGIDFDNTIVTYDELLFRWMRERGWVGDEMPRTKRGLRDALRALPDGESKWQQAQAFLYGPGLQDAPLIEGVVEFLRACRERGVPVFVISHKTQYAAADPGGVDMRREAMAWMERQGLFGDAMGLAPDRVFFELARADKLARIRSLGCTHFIDDLEETFLEPDFPSDVVKILYAPGGEPDSIRDGVCLRSWRAIHDSCFGLASAVAALLSQRIVDAQPIGEGRNSQAYRVACPGDSTFAAKHYHRAATDRDDRMEVEYAALSLLQAHGITDAPRPIAVDRARRVAVYEFLEGTPVEPANDADIDRLATFLVRLKALGHEAAGEWTRWADEALVSFEAVEEHIRGRLEALDRSDQSDQSDRSDKSDLLRKDLRAFIQADLDPLLHAVIAWGAPILEDLGWPWSRTVPEECRILSPSDFGFHNAVRTREGAIRFLDFEYFGWDDPAKTVADVLLHPAMRLSEAHRERFVAGACDGLGDPLLVKRLPVAYALLGVKWCTILLNEFLPGPWARRQFAGGARNREEVLAAQLDKARAMARHVAGAYKEFPYHG